MSRPASLSAPSSTGDRALQEEHTVAEFVAYLHRIGYHLAAERTSRDRQIIVIRPDKEEQPCP